MRFFPQREELEIQLVLLTAKASTLKDFTLMFKILPITLRWGRIFFINTDISFHLIIRILNILPISYSKLTGCCHDFFAIF